MTNEPTQVSSCIPNPVSLAETYPWQFEDETPAIVKAYFNALGIMDWLPEEDFERSLSQRFGSEATEYLEATKSKTYMGKQAASLKSGNLELALAVRSQYDGTRYEAFFSWLAAANLPQPKRILDVGCDIGITTCFCATLYPEATVIGIDCSREAVECAKKLAAKLHLTNVEFIEADVRHLPDGLKGENFDLVCSNSIAGYFVSPNYEDTVEELLEGADPFGKDYARVLADFLADDKSTLVSFEDTFTPHELASWLWALHDAGIYVPAETVEMLDFFDTEYGCDEGPPVMIGSKQAATLPTAEEIRSLWTGGIDDIPEQDVYVGIIAESVLAATEPKELRHSFLHAAADSLDDSKTELWEAGTQVLIYKCSRDGRKLVRLPQKTRAA